MLDKMMSYGWVIFIITTIIIHFLKIIYIYFKPTFLKKYSIVSNTSIPESKLSLYYLLTILVLIKIVIEKLEIVLK